MGPGQAPRACSSAMALGSEASLAAGSEAQKRTYLSKLVTGERIGTLAFAEGAGNPDAVRMQAHVANGKLSGTKLPVADGEIADFAVVAANGTGKASLCLVDLGDPGVTRSSLKSLDP